jgi:gas vesicle protein
MSGAELRKELHNYIDHADDTFLKMVHAMSKEYKKSEIAGYNIDGSPITQKDLSDRVKAASKRVKDGLYTTQEEVEKEMRNW